MVPKSRGDQSLELAILICMEWLRHAQRFCPDGHALAAGRSADDNFPQMMRPH